ncbi:MAG: bifunctional 4-hydroxy-2-oxoglutarate aldolase/2-dehydro-3-deoxy-phosphogluconate aldolase [Rhizobiaceae bacterium]|nr:bifunctional 4-hydroxy-2-oxoglutarate aldolase/2-dehydro-3-deoxy-phosphogluconate aldolase [Rhizobiaceae bacterium]
MSIRDICNNGPVVPVIEIDDAAHAEPLAAALLGGGISVIEITLRTSAALDAIAAVSSIPDLYVGAGTLLSPSDVEAAKEAGASFGVSPGSTPELIAACKDQNLPFLPGAATPSEVANLLANGFEVQKFFPAEAAGGIGMLKAIAGPMQDVVFCPTGGISRETAPDYLRLPNVLCVGGSWIAPRKLIADQAWGEIEENARLASSLG